MKSLYLILATIAAAVTSEPQRRNDVIWYPVDDEDGVFISTLGERYRTAHYGRFRSHRRARSTEMEPIPRFYDPSDNYDPSFFHNIHERRPWTNLPTIPDIPPFSQHRQFQRKRPSKGFQGQSNQNLNAQNYQEIFNEVFGNNKFPFTGQESANLWDDRPTNQWEGNLWNENTNQWNGEQRPGNQWNSEQRPGNQWNGEQRPGNQWNSEQRPGNQWNGEQRPGNQWNSEQRPGNQWNGEQRPGNQWNSEQRPGNQWSNTNNPPKRPGNQGGNPNNPPKRPGNKPQRPTGSKPPKRPGGQSGNTVNTSQRPDNQWTNGVDPGQRPGVTRPIEKPTSEWITPDTKPGSNKPNRPTNQSDKLVFPEPANTSKRPTTTPSNFLPTDPPTLSPCEISCPVTPEFNPVCGSDSVTYSNAGRLKCARMCGKDVQLSHYGNCGRTPFSTPLVSSNPRIFW